MVLDIWSDVVCPWCYIGRARLKKTLAELGQPVELRWRAFELQPDLPPEGVEARPFYEKKFGKERLEDIFGRVSTVAAQDGLELRYDLIQRAPNTRLAHRAVKLASDPDAAVGALFHAHFEEGLNVADKDVLLSVLTKAGLDGADLGRRLDAGEATEAVLEDEQLAGELGIGGVPFFVADRRLGLSGAQPLEVFHAFLQQAALPGDQHEQA